MTLKKQNNKITGTISICILNKVLSMLVHFSNKEHAEVTTMTLMCNRATAWPQSLAFLRRFRYDTNSCCFFSPKDENRIVRNMHD